VTKLRDQRSEKYSNILSSGDFSTEPALSEVEGVEMTYKNLLSSRPRLSD